MPFPPRPTSPTIFVAPIRYAWSYAPATLAPAFSRAVAAAIGWYVSDDPFPPRDPPPDPPPPGPQPPDPDPPPVPAMVLDLIDALAEIDGEEYAAGWAAVRGALTAMG